MLDASKLKEFADDNFKSYENGTKFSKKVENAVGRGPVLDASELKEFADDNFKFYENGTKFSKRIENAVGKGEIARYEQFLLFPQCFQWTCTADT